MSLVVLLLTLVMLVDEARQFVNRSQWSSALGVDTRQLGADAKMSVNVDITFPSMKCGVFAFDSMDLTGEMQLNDERKMVREPV